MRKPLRVLASNRLALLAMAVILLALLTITHSRASRWGIPLRFGFNNTDHGDNIRLLSLKQPIQQELPAGKIHSYRITLGSGQYLRLAVHQWNIDLSVAIYGVSGQKLIEYGCRQNGLTPVSLIAESDEDYRVEVRSLDKEPAPGRYQVEIEEIRTAEAQDKNRVAAERTFAEGEQFQIEGKAESARMAINKYQEALLCWQSAGEKREEANTLNRIGDAYHLLGEPQKAIERYNTALQISQEVNWRQGQGEALNDISYVYLFLGEPQKALEYSTQALNLSRTTGDQRGNARALNNIGEAYNAFGNLQKALDYYHQALPIWCAVSDRRGQAQTLLYIGYTYSDLSEAQKAFYYYLNALDLWNAVNDYRGQAQTLIALGHLYSKLGEKQEALNLYNQARQSLQSLSDHLGEARILNGIGYVYDELGEKQRALEYHKEALRLFQTMGHRRGEAVSLSMIGRVYYSLGDSPKALDHCQQSLSIARGLANYRFEYYLLGYIGKIHESSGNGKTALDYYNQALSLNRAGKDRREEAYMLNNIGQVYDKSGKKQKALAFYRRALPLNRAAEDRFGESSTLYNMARVERDRSHIAEARDHLESAITIVESLRANVASQALRASYFASIQQYFELNIDLLMRERNQRPSDNFAALGLEQSERARARSLLEQLTEARADFLRWGEPALIERLRGLQRQINAKAERKMQLVNAGATGDETLTVAKEIASLVIEREQVEAQIRAKRPRDPAMAQPQPSSLKEIQQLLDENTLLLEYALGSERSYLWAVTRTGLQSYELPGRAAIEKTARSVYDLLISRQPAPGQTEEQRDAQYWRQASALSRMLLNPVAGQLCAKRLLIVADGVLQYIPFGALPEPETGGRGDRATGRRGNGEMGRRDASRPVAPSPRLPVAFEPLIVKHEIVNLPSASMLAVLRRETQKRSLAPKTIAVLADPVFEADDLRVLAAQRKIKGSQQQQVASAQSTRTFGGQGLTRSGINLSGLPSTRREAEAIRRVAPADGMFALGFD
ncbi:MAG: tetratricopeptide repeat protein, partial [Blastocatellia bacterium]